MNMKAGRVVQMRVNPKDCMGAIDLVKKTGVYVPGMSFAQVVSLAIGISLETFRSKGILPTRDGFEYANMMHEFPDPRRGSKIKSAAIGRAMDSLGSELKAPVADSPDVGDDYEGPPVEPEYTEEKLLRHSNPRVRVLFIRGKELTFKRDADPTSFSPEDANELDRIETELGHLV